MYGSTRLDDGKTLDGRLGWQVLNWGGSQLVGGGIGVVTGIVGANKVFPKALKAERVPVTAEAGFSHIDALPDPQVLRFGRETAYGAALAGAGGFTRRTSPAVSSARAPC